MLKFSSRDILVAVLLISIVLAWVVDRQVLSNKIEDVHATLSICRDNSLFTDYRHPGHDSIAPHLLKPERVKDIQILDVARVFRSAQENPFAEPHLSRVARSIVDGELNIKTCEDFFEFAEQRDLACLFPLELRTDFIAFLQLNGLED